jgi:acetylornithine deacetylase/succinyl-diaminopimelate desuccinylase-like protein
VPDQAMDDILDKLEAHLRRAAPPGAEVTIDWRLPGAPAMLTPADHPAVRAAVDALAESFGRRAEVVRQGFSVPVNEIAHRNLGLPAVMLGFASPTDSIHAPDEHFSLASFQAGRQAAVEFLRGYAALASV